MKLSELAVGPHGHLLSALLSVARWESTVSAGDEVEIAHGALQGFQGTVVEVLPSQERIKLLVEFLGNQQVLETDLFSLLLPNKPIPE